MDFDSKNFNPKELTDQVIALGEEWADKDSAASALEESKKSVLAKLVTEHLEKGRSGESPRGISVSAAELKALGDPKYEVHVDLMVQARKEANKARVRYDMGKMQLELIRSLQATLRSEMNLNKGVGA